MYDIGLAAKIINSHVRMAGLADILGATGGVNVQGEVVQKLDEFANDTMKHTLLRTGRTCSLASEEDEELVPIPRATAPASTPVLYDPLDGSSNIDVNVSIGTIFSIHRRVSPDSGPGELRDCLQVGRTQVAAGYVLYGSSTMLVYSTGQGVHGFTFDPSIGEFLLSHPNITTPPVGKYYSVNESNFPRWDPAVQRVGPGLEGRGAGHRNQELALHRLAGRRLPSQPDGGRRLRLSRRPEVAQRQAATAVRVRAAGLHLRARPAATRRTAASASWTSFPPSCTSARRCSSAAATTCGPPRRH